MRVRTWTALLVLLIGTPAWAADLSDQEMEDFLLHAEVIQTREISVGITHSLHATLQRGEFVHDAQIQRIDEYKPVAQLNNGAVVNFRDYWGFNIVAYRLDRLLGLNMLPVSVARKYGGEESAFTWWIDDVQMMEKQRWENHIHPPNLRAWNEQMHAVRVFNELTYNTDANLGNVLILKDWSIRLIDYTRAFNANSHLRQPENLLLISRRLLQRLRALDPDDVRKACSPYLNHMQIAGLLKRRDRIVELFDRKIAEEGEDAVLYGLP